MTQRLQITNCKTSRIGEATTPKKTFATINLPTPLKRGVIQLTHSHNRDSGDLFGFNHPQHPTIPIVFERRRRAIYVHGAAN
jgi:hypothetical protein